MNAYIYFCIPFLNLIENMFTKWKGYNLKENPKNKNKLLNYIENNKTLITSFDIDSYFKNMTKYILKCMNKKVINDQN